MARAKTRGKKRTRKKKTRIPSESSTSTRPEPNYGIVGLFDILGFKNFLQNNDPIYAGRVASECLSNAFSNIRQVNPGILPQDEVRRLYDEVSQSFQWLVFSDTILVTLPLKKGLSGAKLFASWLTYTFASMLLYRYMLDHGLPIRGGVTVGDYLIRQSCFSGRSIVTAYHLGTELDMSAVVLDAAATESLDRGFKATRFTSKHIVHRYNIPLKGGYYRNGFLLSPTPCAVPFIGDFTQAIYSSFFMHNKDIDADVQRKIHNTEAYFRFSKLVHSHAFLDAPEDGSTSESKSVPEDITLAE